MSVILLSSCSKVDDGNDSSALIGVWSPIKEVRTCSSGSEEVEEYDTCYQKATFTFYKDGTYIIKDIDTDDNGDCVLYEQLSGTWSLNDGVFIYNFFFTATIEINGNILRITETSEEDDGYLCDDGSSEITAYTEYIRVTN